MRPVFSQCYEQLYHFTPENQQNGIVLEIPLNLHLVRQRHLINLGTNTHKNPGIVNSSPHKILIFLHITVSQECCENTLSHHDLPHTQKIIILHGREHQWIL